MDIERLLLDFNIPYATEEHKHCTDGWVNVHCPFCVGQQNFHLGISKEHGGCHCWRCGGKSTINTLGKILGLPPAEVTKILRNYDHTATRRKLVKEPEVSIHPFKYPSPNFPLTRAYKNYLAGRGFDPDHLEQEWKLLQTGPVSFLDGIAYNHRIIIPIYWDGKPVSFQARDITGHSDRKYLACPRKRERVHHKDILYGKQELWESLSALIIVEGVTDVWRLGPCAVATLGIEFKMEQVLHLAKYNDRFFIAFDNDLQAQMQARKLSIKLRALGKKVHIETIKEDPGSMSQDDADHFVKELLGEEVGK